MTITWKITLSIDENMLKRTRHAHFQLYILFCDYTAVAFHDSQLKKKHLLHLILAYRRLLCSSFF